MMKTIKVGGITYKVELKDLSTRNDGADGKQLGWCVYDEDKIEINERLTQPRIEQTLIHELVHAVMYEAGLEQDEDMVNRIGLVLHQVLKDNDFSWMNKPKYKTIETNGVAVEIPLTDDKQRSYFSWAQYVPII